MSVELEQFLAVLYTERQLRERFLADPFAVAAAAGLDEPTCVALARIDRTGLELHAHSVSLKRRANLPNARPRLRDRLRALFG